MLGVTLGQICLSERQDVLRQIEGVFHAAGSAELIILPEYTAQSDAISLKDIDYLKDDRDAMAAAEVWCRHNVKHAQIIDLANKYGKAVAFGSLHQDVGRLTSRCVFYDPVETVENFYDKTHVHWTESFLRPGNHLEPFDTRFGRIGMLICYDTAFTEAARVLGLKGADILLTIAATPRHFDWRYVHRRLAGAAINNQLYVLGAHLGYSEDIPMGGHTAIFGPHGELVASIEDDGPGVVHAELDFEAMRQWRDVEKNVPFRRYDLYTPLAE